ncbi:MAG TPA: DUF4129 domain-containing protein [Chloroflexota bacterium]|nr:DUF4129 domain-containing protein [Chloroflexota bacterium]
MTSIGKSWTGYSWLRDGLILGADALLESLWAFALIDWALAANAATAGTRFPFAWLTALIMVPALIGRALEYASALSLRTRRIALLALAIALFLAFNRAETLPPRSMLDWRWYIELLAPWSSGELANELGFVIFGWLVAAALLARGAWLALGDVSADGAGRWFLLGLAVFLGVLGIEVLAPAPAYESIRVWLGPLLGGYLFAGLGWLGLVRQLDLEQQAFRHASGGLSGSWLLMFGSISAFMLGVSALAAVLGSAGLRLVGELAVFLVELVLRAALAIWQWLLATLTIVMRSLPVGHPGEANAPQPSPRSPQPLPHLVLPDIHLPIQLKLAVVFVCLILLGVGVVALAMGMRDRLPNEAEERTSLWSWGLLWGHLRQAWASLLDALRRRRRAEIAPQDAASAGNPVPPHSVRALYLAVLRWSRERGRPRNPGETPLEFEPALAERLPTTFAEDLTSAYEQVRYAERPLEQAVVQPLLEAWQSEAVEEPTPPVGEVG